MRNRPGPWRPDWPARLWLLPVATGIAAPVVAQRTNGSGCTTSISAGAWALWSATVVLTVVLAYAFSRQSGRSRIGVAVLVGVIVGVVVFLLTAFLAAAHSACD
jgi:hypothetical protein